MQNLDLRFESDMQVDGILLYPTVKEHFSLRYDMHGQEVRVQSIDLTQDWRCIHNDLLALPSAFQSAAQGPVLQGG
ncbi:MAG: hypothetical protein QGI75_03495 [Phycisphaerales bacterium]|jgi:hypothetical protein|nr:hypothetical protein [Phycisphaerales bacterium]MDP6890828.1 hypothetical protein [Phycisphaerales bacterium]